MIEHPLLLVADEGPGARAGGRPVVEAFLPEAAKEALPGQPIRFPHHQHRELRFTAGAVAPAYFPEIPAEAEDAPRRDALAEVAEDVGVGERAALTRGALEEGVELIDVDHARTQPAAAAPA